MPAARGESGCLSKCSLPPLIVSGKKTFIDRGRGLHAVTVQSALTVILKLLIGGLNRVILIVLGTLNLQFHVKFVSISLRPIIRSVEAYVMTTIWS